MVAPGERHRHATLRPRIARKRHRRPGQLAQRAVVRAVGGHDPVAAEVAVGTLDLERGGADGRRRGKEHRTHHPRRVAVGDDEAVGEIGAAAVGDQHRNRLQAPVVVAGGEVVQRRGDAVARAGKFARKHELRELAGHLCVGNTHGRALVAFGEREHVVDGEQHHHADQDAHHGFDHAGAALDETRARVGAVPRRGLAMCVHLVLPDGGGRLELVVRRRYFAGRLPEDGDRDVGAGAGGIVSPPRSGAGPMPPAAAAAPTRWNSV